MAKTIQRARKRLPKAKPAAGEAAAGHVLTGSAITDLFSSPAPSSAPGAFASLGPEVDPFTSEEHCWYSVGNLFHKIEKHHGVEVATHFFLAFAAPSKRRQKRVQEETLWITYELMRKHERVGMKKAAQLIHERGFKFGATPDAIEQHLKRLQRERRKKS